MVGDVEILGMFCGCKRERSREEEEWVYSCISTTCKKKIEEKQ